ncbi:unnamed protein product [Rotaria magnacalcarata]|uniref:Uncharacterized protein n=4 Tax=Rotaria magnacalcarata TaxID=392030 RepID=A0A819CTF7_9BILA|nr:unnamed protein product [Rotaria magnacalcarata]CAF4391311.1 unnamed protein product [Rotaria magnacalcarata]
MVNIIEEAYAATQFDDIDKVEVPALMKGLLKSMCISLPSSFTCEDSIHLTDINDDQALNNATSSHSIARAAFKIIREEGIIDIRASPSPPPPLSLSIRINNVDVHDVVSKELIASPDDISNMHVVIYASVRCSENFVVIVIICFIYDIKTSSVFENNAY